MEGGYGVPVTQWPGSLYLCSLQKDKGGGPKQSGPVLGHVYVMGCTTILKPVT